MRVSRLFVACFTRSVELPKVEMTALVQCSLPPDHMEVG